MDDEKWNTVAKKQQAVSKLGENAIQALEALARDPVQ
jgi:hypothetical protein